MVPLKIVSNVSRFKPALNLSRVLADLNRGLNSLNSISVRSNNISLKYQRVTTSGFKDIGIRKSEFVAKNQLLCVFLPDKSFPVVATKKLIPIGSDVLTLIGYRLIGCF